jgi:hypothetical protein
MRSGSPAALHRMPMAPTACGAVWSKVLVAGDSNDINKILAQPILSIKIFLYKNILMGF